MRFKKNIKGKDYIVGDIHGHYDLLREKLEELSFNKEADRLFSVGDLIDRGPKSLECLSLVFEPWFFSIRGNHEQMMFDSLLNKDKRALSLWLYNGGIWMTDILDTDYLLGIAKETFKLMPLWFTIETSKGDIGVVHAEPPEDWNEIENTSNQTLIWSRDKILHRDETVVKNIGLVYVGHTPVKEVTVLGNVRYIDTGAFHTGNLTVEYLTN